MKTNTRIDALVPWRPDFDQDNPLFEPLRPLLEAFRAYPDWPALEDYRHLLEQFDPTPRTAHGASLKVVAQQGRPSHFEQHYAPRIYLTGEIQTRTRNWHDLFQLLSWLVFPRTKAAINALHIPAARKRFDSQQEPGRRSPLENMLSLFDEGGAVLLSSDETLLDLVRDFQWQELFWHRRRELASKFECVVFGHAMYEKGLKPYLGMTANSVLLKVDECWFEQPLESRLATIDARLSDLFAKQHQYQNPRDLNPFPILGMPGWDGANADETYYHNADYFRPGRRRG